MRNIGLPTGWTKRFKQQIVLWSIVGVSPLMLFLNRASDVPEGVSHIAMLSGALWVVAGGTYIVTHRPSPAWEKMSERESLAVGVLMALVAALIAFNGVEMFVRYGHAAGR
jgi:hypothetical protein